MSQSTIGYYLIAIGALIIAKLGYQKIIYTSTIDAKFINLTLATKAAEDVVGLLYKIGYNSLDLCLLQMFNNNINTILYTNR